MMSELFQCFDEDMNPTECLPRNVVHREGHWHQAIHCWVVGLDEETRNPYILIQKRHPCKDTYPNYFDISAAGHLLAGETVEEGLREIKEELGIDVDPAKLTFLGMAKEATVITSELIDREFCFVYLYEASLPVEAYKLQEEEVTGLYRIDLYEFVELVERRSVNAIGVGIEINVHGKYDPVTKQISYEELVPFSKSYYSFLLPHLLNFGEQNR